MIITNYIKYTLDFSLTNSRLNFSLILQSRQFTNSHGFFIFGPIDTNLIYMATLTVCSPIKLINTSVEDDDCIKSQSLYFSKKYTTHLKILAFSLSYSIPLVTARRRPRFISNGICPNFPIRT